MLLWSFEGCACGYGCDTGASTAWAVIAAGIHLFPFRTEQLSPSAPMVLGAQAPGRVGRRRVFHRAALRGGSSSFPVAEVLGEVAQADALGGARAGIAPARASRRKRLPSGHAW